MTNKEIIKKVQSTLPPTIAAIGYGSGIFKQSGYKEDEIPDKDIIVVVDNFIQFLIDDYEMNNHHFAQDFDKHILASKKNKSNFYRNLGCLKFSEDGIRFKLMIISKSALEYDLSTWRYFGMAGRLTKPILYDKIPQSLEKAIRKNRKNALITALLYNPKEEMTLDELYNTISELTYINDFRTILPAEKKTKPNDIVEGAKSYFDQVYGSNTLLDRHGDIIYNNHPTELIRILPYNLKKYLYSKLSINNDSDLKNLDPELVSAAVEYYLQRINFINSIRLAISSGTTLGIKGSLKHGVQKVKKRFSK